jgi:hypothetical protein
VPSVADPTTCIPSARFSHRKAALLATLVAAAGVGGVTIAVVDDGGSGTGSQSLSRPAPDMRFPTEGAAAQSIRPQPIVQLNRPSEGTAVRSMRTERIVPLNRPSEGTAVQSMRTAALTPLARPDEGVAVQSMARSDYSAGSDGGPEEGVLGR